MKNVKIYQLQSGGNYTIVTQGEGGPDVMFEKYEVESILGAVEEKEIEKIKKNPRKFVHKGRVRNRIAIEAEKEVKERVDNKDKKKKRNGKMIAGSIVRSGDKKSRLMKSIRKGVNNGK